MIPDPGTWTVRVETESRSVFLVSDGEQGVWLRVVGDFADHDEKLAYARDIARRLNETRP